MNKMLIYCLAILLLTACRTDEPAPGVLPVSKMQAVVWDLMRADEFEKSFAAADSSLLPAKRFRRRQAIVFAYHEVAPKQFFDSYRHYQSHPALQKQLFDSLDAMAKRAVRPRKTAYPVKS